MGSTLTASTSGRSAPPQSMICTEVGRRFWAGQQPCTRRRVPTFSTWQSLPARDPAYYCQQSAGQHQRSRAGIIARDSQGEGALLSAESAAQPEREQLKLTVQIIPAMDKVSAADWDACAVGDGEMNPFVLHAFLLAMETSGSAVKEQGWLPQHVLVRNEVTGQLLGACPLYLKSHSYGEYVFDNSWASSYSNALGKQYYPKLQCCVPFTPATGARLLVAAGPMAAAVRRVLAQTLKSITDELGVSSLHVTFNNEAEAATMTELGYLQRSGIQYHWENHGYNTFDDFLMTLKQSKRKNIRQERKHVAAAGLRVERLRGADLKTEHWDSFYEFYRNTTDRKWGQAYLTREFFHQLGETMPEHVMLVVAREAASKQIAAGALNLIGSEAIFGRNWGCHPTLNVKHLHFEMCYYQAIEAAIELGLPRVEAGAQGEHKISRGYLPSPTYSSHYIVDPSFRSMVGRFLSREGMDIEYTMKMLSEESSPYKDADVSASISE